MVERAPFAARPDTRRAGDLLGPYDGIVVDAQTERPVSGATVEATWAFERGLGLIGPDGSHQVLAETDGDGRYHFARLEDLPSGLSMRVRRFTLVVYKRGYVGWRSDTHFPSETRRHDFTQRGNRARLDKWRPENLHHRHLAFLGGGPVIADAAAWEIEPASLELEGREGVGNEGPRSSDGSHAPAAQPRLLDISNLLTQDDVRGVTGFAGPFAAGRLADLPRNEFYDTRHFKATGQPESFDVAVRVWRLGPAAEEQYRKVLADLPRATRSDEIGDAAVRAQTASARALVYLSRGAGAVVSVTCGTAQCTEPAMVLRLAKLVDGRLAEIPPPGPAKEGNEVSSPSNAPASGASP